jgi:hypothetical protein
MQAIAVSLLAMAVVSVEVWEQPALRCDHVWGQRHLAQLSEPVKITVV